MFRDPIQERLQEMEKINPSSVSYPSNFLRGVKDSVYFTCRYLTSKIEKYEPIEFPEGAIACGRALFEASQKWSLFPAEAIECARIIRKFAKKSELEQNLALTL